MARNSSSHVKFDVEIKGVSDAKELSKLMPKVIKQFNDLAKAMDKVEATQAKSSVKDVKERIIMMNVKSIKGEIDSLQRLGAEYGSIENQINSLEKAGKPVAKLREQAAKQHMKLRDEIIKREKATQQLKNTEQQSSKATSQMGSVAQSQTKNLQNLTAAQQRSNKEISQGADGMRHASYVWLNAGYLIQDSPYGIRGMANNVSQLAQAWQMLGNQVNMINQTQQGSTTIWKELIHLLKGPTGIILLIGSVLPTALVLLERHWDDMFGTVKDGIEDFEGIMEKINEFVNMQIEFESPFGSDPLGIIQMRKELDQLGLIEEDLKEFADAVQRSLDIRRPSQMQMGQSMGIGFVDPENIKNIRESEEVVTRLEEKFGALSEVDLTELQKGMEEIRKELLLSEAMMQRSEGGGLEQSFSEMTDGLIDALELFEDDLISPSRLNSTRNAAQLYLKELERSYIEFINSNQFDYARIAKEHADRLREALEQESGKEKKEEVDEIEDIEDQYELRKRMMDDLISTRLFNSELAIDDAFTTEEQIEAISEASAHRMRQIRREDFENLHAYELARREEAEKTKDKINELKRDQVIFDLNMKNMLLQEGIDSPSNFDSHMNALKDYYDRREDVIRKSAETENQLKQKLFENDQQRRKAEEQAEKTLAERKLSITQNYAQGAIYGIQAIANASNASAKVQFQIQKIASASTAIINAHVAYTKTLAAGGFLAVPLAKSTLALGYAQAAAIMSQSYDSARATGSRAGSPGFSALTSYRGFDFEETGGMTQPYSGSNVIGNNRSQSANMFPSEIKAKFTDGFGKVVSEGMVQLQRDNRENLDYWQ